MAETLGIVFPAYNEAARLSPALDELFAYLRSTPAKALPEKVVVLVVDDGSTDGTADLVRARPEFVLSDFRLGHDHPSLRLLVEQHGGKGSAFRAGMLAAYGDLLVFADADMATPPDQLPKLVEAFETADFALGSRIPSRMGRICGLLSPLSTNYRPAIPLSAQMEIPPAVDTGGRHTSAACQRRQGVSSVGGSRSIWPNADHEHRLRRGSHLRG